MRCWALPPAPQLGLRGRAVLSGFLFVTNLGVFACILAMRRGGEAVENIDDLAGLARTQADARVCLRHAMMLSLSGLPPIAGILRQVFVFLAAIQAHLYVPAIIGVVTSVVGAFYYLRIVKLMYFDEPAPASTRHWPSLGAVAGLASVFTLLFVVGAAPLLECGRRCGADR